MSFFFFSNINIQFSTERLICRLYTIIKALPTTRRVKLIDKMRFPRIALDKNSETFVVHIAALDAVKITIYSFWKAKVASLQVNNASIEILSKYLDYANISLIDFAIKLLEHNGINNHTISPIEYKHLFMGQFIA